MWKIKKIFLLFLYGSYSKAQRTHPPHSGVWVYHYHIYCNLRNYQNIWIVKRAKEQHTFCEQLYKVVVWFLFILQALPCKIDVIKHANEHDGKSTSTHAAVIAPAMVRIYTFPDFPDYRNENGVCIFSFFSRHVHIDLSPTAVDIYQNSCSSKLYPIPF